MFLNTHRKSTLDGLKCDEARRYGSNSHSTEELSMTYTVFLSGSRKISRLNDDIRLRLDKITSQGLSIIVGDANGADKSIQTYLANIHYNYVTVFCSGEHMS